MYIKKNSRRALLLSVMSLILCCAMLVGTTFAWFTDEVKSGMNTIAAGNLDVELLANGSKVESTTKLFTDLNGKTIDKWEPGMVAYENLQVANVGSLALKYQMTLNFGNENDLNGHKLSEVLKVAVLNEPITGKTRAEVLELAKAAVKADQGNGALSNFYQTGVLAPKGETMTVENTQVGDTSAEAAVVIYWEPGDNDNWYNANNGQTTSDGQPLHIEFGVHLQATQQVNEYDSFGNDYDKLSSILPKATVNNTGAKAIDATYGIGGNVNNIALDTSFQFLPNETLDEAQTSDYRYWHADFVVKANKDVPAESVALAGYYNEWCQFNNDNWVALVNDQPISANTEIRLVEMLGASVNYEEICRYGFDDSIDFEKRGFLCGAADLTGENAGTTITVELRMYETTIDPSNPSGSANIETGNYEVIGVKTHTFGGSYVNNADGSVLFKNNEGDVLLYDASDVETTNYAVPAGVTTVDGYVFYGNTSVKEVTMPDSLKKMEKRAFENSAVEKVTLNEGLTEISEEAFCKALNIKEVNIPSTVNKIGYRAFRQTALETLDIPATVTNIDTESCRDISNLTTVIIRGNAVIGNYAFRSCPKLTTVYLLGEDITFTGTSQVFCRSDNAANMDQITIYVKNQTVADRLAAAQGSAKGYNLVIDPDIAP